MVARIKEFYIRVTLGLLTLCAYVLVVESIPQKDGRKVGRLLENSVPCSKFEFEGYHCVSEEKCGYDYYEISDLITEVEIRIEEKDLFKEAPQTYSKVLEQPVLPFSFEDLVLRMVHIWGHSPLCE